MESSRASHEEPTVETRTEHPVALGGEVRPERRSTSRRILRAPIAARVKGFHFGRVLDLSTRGALADTLAILRPLESNELVLRFPDGPLVAKATVRRCRAWGHVVDVEGARFVYYRSGFEFDGLSLPQLELLERHLRALELETAADLPSPPAGEGQLAPLVERRLAREGVPFRLRPLAGGPPKNPSSPNDR